MLKFGLKWLWISIGSIILICFMTITSFLLYIVLYHAVVPPISHSFPLYFHFHPTKLAFPTASLSFPPSFFSSLQDYSVAVSLTLPESPINEQLGNFMVQLSFFDSDLSLIETAARAYILKYKSSLLKIAQFFWWNFVGRLFGWHDECQTVYSDILSSTSVLSSLSSLTVTIQNMDVQIYNAEIRFNAMFNGVVYFMYYWKVTSTIIGLIFFFGLQCMALYGVYIFVWPKIREMIEEENQQEEKDYLLTSEVNGSTKKLNEEDDDYNDNDNDNDEESDVEGIQKIFYFTDESTDQLCPQKEPEQQQQQPFAESSTSSISSANSLSSSSNGNPPNSIDLSPIDP